MLPAQSRTDGDAFWLGATRDVHTATAAYGVIVVDDVTDRTAQVTGGRLLAQLHLAATALGLGFHHMNQITERIDRDRALGNPDAFSGRWSAVLGRPASTGLVSFRVGHPERTPGPEPPARPGRRGGPVSGPAGRALRPAGRAVRVREGRPGVGAPAGVARFLVGFLVLWAVRRPARGARGLPGPDHRLLPRRPLLVLLIPIRKDVPR